MNDKDKAKAVLTVMQTSQAWREDSMHWRGEVLIGEYAHWCPEWDGLPVDETCIEWPCGCVVFEQLAEELKAKFRSERDKLLGELDEARLNAPE